MKVKKSSVYFVVCIVLIIVFDALQQQYYLNTYSLLGEGIWASFTPLLLSHAIRWSIWILFVIPISFYLFRSIRYDQLMDTTFGLLRLLLFIFIANAAALFAIVCTELIKSGTPVFSQEFVGYLEFFVYQKGISFILATGIVILILYTESKSEVIEAQWMEIDELKKTDPALPRSADPNIKIKIGNKVKLIPVSEITWIESDDYCVKVHTLDKVYSLRKSLSYLEKMLAEHRFVRVHRCALLNLGYMEQVDFNELVIKLQDRSEIPLSQSGAKVLRKVMDAQSL